MQALADTAEGYDAADMHTLLERVLHAAVTRRLRGRPSAAAQTLHVSSLDFKSAQSNFQPASAWGVGHQRKGQQVGCCAALHHTCQGKLEGMLGRCDAHVHQMHFLCAELLSVGDLIIASA